MRKFFLFLRLKRVQINSAINTTELKKVPTTSTTNAGIKWETEN
jgi:hypothetical protein